MTDSFFIAGGILIAGNCMARLALIADLGLLSSLLSRLRLRLLLPFIPCHVVCWGRMSWRNSFSSAADVFRRINEGLVELRSCWFGFCLHQGQEFWTGRSGQSSRAVVAGFDGSEILWRLWKGAIALERFQRGRPRLLCLLTECSQGLCRRDGRKAARRARLRRHARRPLRLDVNSSWKRAEQMNHDLAMIISFQVFDVVGNQTLAFLRLLLVITPSQT